VTDALFGAEEQQQRELLMLMAQDQDPTLSMEEKADRAQATHQRLQRDMQDAVRR
jgi:lipase chaperone LimK